jgi:hypothetical protein
MTWNTRDGGDKIQQAAQMAKDDIEKRGGTAYTRVTDPLPDLIPNLGVQVAVVAPISDYTYHRAWEVTTYNPWVTEDGELERASGWGVGPKFKTEADAVAVAKALIKADWS